MQATAQNYYPAEWEDVRPYRLDQTYEDVMDSVDDGYNGRYTLVERKEDGRIFVKKTFSKNLIRSVRPRRWLREVRVLRDIRHKNIQCYQESYLCSTHGEIYLEYCNYGTLDHFKNYMDVNGKKIPESFVWNVFSGLIKALCFMHYGIEDIEKMDEEDPYDCGSASEWTPVLHCDIAMDCVFLKTYRGAKYPVAKLGKFNWGVHKLEPEYVDQVAGDAGTEGFVSPEHPHKSKRGDVFQVGAVIQCLCNPDWLKADPRLGVGEGYGPEINAYVKSAMTPDKKQRPTAAELGQKIVDLELDAIPDYEEVPDEAFERLLPQPY